MKSKWVRTQDSEDSQDPDTISTYLTDPVIKSSAVKEAGGVVKDWDQATQHHPRVAKMGLDFCSAPGDFHCFYFYLYSAFCIASSVDAECAFSVGRLEVNHLQHNT